MIRRAVLSFFAAALALMLAGFSHLPAFAQERPKPMPDAPDTVRQAVEGAIQKVYPALVRIHVVAVFYRDGREEKHEGSGSGVIISSEGFVITNHHVAGKCKRIRVTLSDKEELEATLVGSDPLADIAVIKLQRGEKHKNKQFPYVSFGDSAVLRVGDRVMAMGSPLALSQSVTLGIVSNMEMTIPRLFWPFTFKLDGEDVGSLVKWIGHDAQIFPGNSGGPLVNLKGEIVGINDIGLGLGGAIPGNLARDVSQELIKSGEVKRSWTGLNVQPLLKSSKRDQGVLVGGVVAGSPAEKAGIQPGDILLSYNGERFAIRHPEQLTEFNRLVLGTPVGSKAELVVERDGQPKKLSLTTIARGNAQGIEAELSNWGITVQDLTLLAAKELKREPYSGVLVTSLRPGAAAGEAKPALQMRDVIVEVGGKPVRNLKELIAVSDALTQGETQAKPVLVEFERKTQRLLTVVKLGERETPDRSPEASKAWLAIDTQVLTAELAEALNLKGKKGVRITEVFPDSLAAKAGLKVGDIILKFEGDPIEATEPEQTDVFPTMVRKYRIGAKAKLDIVRAGKEMTVEVELAASPRSIRELLDYHNTSFDFRARNLTFQDRQQQQLKGDQKGALITAVDSGGWAALAHLAVGDIVLNVDGNKVETLADLREQMKKIAATKPERVVFFLRRGVHTLYLEIEPDWTSK